MATELAPLGLQPLCQTKFGHMILCVHGPSPILVLLCTERERERERGRERAREREWQTNADNDRHSTLTISYNIF